MKAQACVVSSRPPKGEETEAGLVFQDDPIIWILTGKSSDSVQDYGQETNLRLVSVSSPGLVAGRHMALEVCDSTVIVYLDDDVLLPCGWWKKILEPFENPKVHFVGCRYLPEYEKQPPPWLEGLWDEVDGFRILPSLSLLDGGLMGRFYDPGYVWGLCFAVRRDTLLKLGGFHPDGYPWDLRRYRGDGETGLAQKAKAQGLNAYYQGETHVMHKVPASRMTPGYFERRAFLQGISDSYTQVRRDGLPQFPQAKSWKDWPRRVKRGYERVRVLRDPTARGVRSIMQQAYIAGFDYHQEEVRRDASLLAWVLKHDYFDYRLPSDWRQYVN